METVNGKEINTKLLCTQRATLAEEALELKIVRGLESTMEKIILGPHLECGLGLNTLGMCFGTHLVIGA